MAQTKSYALLGKKLVRRAGFSIAELVVSMATLALVLIGVFVLFNFSARGFQLINTRQDVQNEVLKARQWLERDFTLTHLGSVGVKERTVSPDGITHSRDAVCLLSVSDWQQDSNFFSLTGLPRWNQYVVYYATRDEPSRLMRSVIVPENPPPPLKVRPFPRMMGGTDPENFPPAEVIQSQQVANNVLEFECRLDLAGQSLIQNLKVRRREGYSGMGNKKTDEVLEATFRWDPINTTPKI